MSCVEVSFKVDQVFLKKTCLQIKEMDIMEVAGPRADDGLLTMID